MCAAEIEEQAQDLFEVIERYLNVVEGFRAEGVELHFADDEALPLWWLQEWRSEASHADEEAPSSTAF